MNYLADADYESGRNKRNALTLSPENIRRSGLGKKFWNIKVKKCGAKAASLVRPINGRSVAAANRRDCELELRRHNKPLHLA